MSALHEALFSERLADRRVHCTLCPHDCRIADGSRGACSVRYNQGGTLYTLAYDRIVASNLENQKYKDKLKAEAEARAERKRQAARALARASGFDPDELARQYGDTPAPAPKPAQPAQKPAPATGER